MEDKQGLLLFHQDEPIDLLQSRKLISWNFARTLDISYVKTVSCAIVAGRSQPGIEFLGEGQHFQSYRFFTGKDMDLAISIACPSFSCRIHNQPKWTSLMDRLSRLVHPLIPPFAILQEIGEGLDSLAYVRPYCSQGVSELSPGRQAELPSLLTGLHDLLDKHGMILDDYPQIRGYKGHPFIVDWSDLSVKVSS